MSSPSPITQNPTYLLNLDPLSPTRLTIHLNLIKKNINSLKNHLNKNTRIMAIVKAKNYGVDDSLLCQFFADCGIDIFGVAYTQEGIVLRKQGINEDLFIINTLPEDSLNCIKYNLQVGVSNLESIKSLSLAAKKANKKAKVHLHINTGMNRLGCQADEALFLAKTIFSDPFLILEGVMTHFSCAESAKEDPFTLQQIKLFDTILDKIKKENIPIPWVHASNSSASIRFKQAHYSMVRIGLAIFGYHLSDSVKKHLPLIPALSLSSKIVGINHCLEKESVSYSRTYRVKNKREVFGVLPIGYADGLHRSYSNKAKALVRGEVTSIAGRICMDFTMIHLSSIPQAKIGDQVTLMGYDKHGNYLEAEELAKTGSTIVHELLSCLGSRISKVFDYGDKDVGNRLT